MAALEEGCTLHEIIEDLGRAIASDGTLVKYFKYPRALYYHLRQLDAMVGMASVKSLVADMVSRHASNMHDKTEISNERDVMNHILLLGSPGSGKTTISALLAKVICAIGFLKVPTPEILKELGDNKPAAPEASESTLLSGRDVHTGHYFNATNELHKNTIRELRDKNLSLTRRLNSVSALTRNLHDDAADLTSTINALNLTLGTNGSETSMPRIPPALGPSPYLGLDSGKLLDNLRTVGHTLYGIRSGMDRLLIMSHVSEAPVVEPEVPPSPKAAVEPLSLDAIKPEADFNPRYVEGSRADLIGGFVGHTAPKVRAMVAKAMGGVLFVDEGYALVNRSNGEPESFSMECINTLCGLMSQYGRYFIFAMAGYTGETVGAATVNQGMVRRFSHIIVMEEYSVTEVETIFRQQLLRAGLAPHSSVNLTDFINRNRKIIGSTGAVCNQLAGVCANMYSNQRFRDIRSGEATAEGRGTVKLAIFERALTYVQRNMSIMGGNNSNLPEHMYL